LEAERCLSKASWTRGNGAGAEFVNPETAAVLASLAQAHATLAHLPEQQAETVEQLRKARRDLAAMREIVGNFAGSALIDEPSVARPAAILARALRDRGLSVDDQIAARVESRGFSCDPHAEIAVDEVAAGAACTDEQVKTTLDVVARQLIRMATSWENRVRASAREFAHELDEAGVNIDRRMDEIAQETGCGPNLYDAFDFRYDLTRQWSDRSGKRWEHTGSWSDVGGPVMRRDEPDGESMVLVELIRERGPLHLVVPPPRSPVVRKDELPPF
jgi:hypothetical protein